MEIKASREELSTWEIQKVNGERVAGYPVQIIVSNYNIEKDVNYFNGFAMEKEAADKVIAAINGREAFMRQELAAKVEQAYTLEALCSEYYKGEERERILAIITEMETKVTDNTFALDALQSVKALISK